MAMIWKRGRKVHFVASIICATFQAVAAIDNHGNQYYVGTDAEIVSISSNISALQIDEPKSSDSKHDQPADASSEDLPHTHSHVVSNTAMKNDHELPSHPAEKTILASSEIECPCAQKL